MYALWWLTNELENQTVHKTNNIYMLKPFLGFLCKTLLDVIQSLWMCTIYNCYNSVAYDGINGRNNMSQCERKRAGNPFKTMLLSNWIGCKMFSQHTWLLAKWLLIWARRCYKINKLLICEHKYGCVCKNAEENKIKKVKCYVFKILYDE